MKIENPTRHKVQEAEYFLSKMKQTLEDDNVFYYNLSAFLAAARTITLYMQKQYKTGKSKKDRKDFDEWYSQKQLKMIADPELKYLIKARDEAIHIETIETGVTRTKTSSIGLTVEKGTPETEQVKEAESKPSAQSSPRTVRRFFPECKEYLFSWNDIPENDGKSLRNFLKKDLKINWIRKATFEKANDNKTIKVTDGKNLITLKLNKEDNKVTLEIHGGETYEYPLKEVSCELKVYSKGMDVIEFGEKQLAKLSKVVEDCEKRFP